VPQVDGEGYLLSDAFVNFVSDLYPEDSLKTLAKELAPDCVTKANAHAKGKCKSNRFNSNHSVRIHTFNYFLFPEHVSPFCLCKSTENIYVFCPINYTTFTERDVII